MELSVKALAQAIADALKPSFDSQTAALNDAQKSLAKQAQSAAIEDLAQKAATDPNAAKFAALLTMSDEARAQVGETERKQALAAGAGLKYARAIRGAALCKHLRQPIENLPALVQDTYKDRDLAQAIEKGMTITDPAAGGFLSAEVWADDFIEVLRPKTILGILGSRTYPMAGAKVHVPRLNAAASFSWVGEAARLPATAPSTARTTLSEKYAGALVPISNALLRDSSPAADAVVRDDLIKVLKLGVDYAAFYGSGNDFQPLGLKNSGIQTYSLAARVDPDTLTNMLEKLWTSNVPMLNPGVAMNAKVYRDFMNLKSMTGEYYYRAEMAAGKIQGMNLGMSTQIPTGVDSYGLTDLFLGDFSEHFIGERTNLGFSIDSSAEAAYYDGSTTQSAFQNLQTLIRAIYVTDFLVRHAESFVVSSDVHTVTP